MSCFSRDVLKYLPATPLEAGSLHSLNLFSRNFLEPIDIFIDALVCCNGAIRIYLAPNILSFEHETTSAFSLRVFSLKKPFLEIPDMFQNNSGAFYYDLLIFPG